MIPGSFPDVNNMIRQNIPFALFRLPGEKMPHLVMQTAGAVKTVDSVESLNGESGFVIAPFQVTGEYPLILIRPDKIEPVRGIQPEALEKEEIVTSTSGDEKTHYQSVFGRFMEPLLSGGIDKLVLSRCRQVERSNTFSPSEAFIKACRNYTRSYVYLCHTPLTGTWLGSTPEIILSGEDRSWQTVALAGTVPLNKGDLPANWNKKNREEQQIVSEYIRKQLQQSGITPIESNPYSVKAASLAHLKTDFRFELPDTSRLGNLLNTLHPTPAVAGLPKEEAIHFITANECYPRAYYSGFLGMLNPDGKSDLYVNLRCMQIHSSYLTLYAGSGLIPGSTMEDEWQETESKLGTMMRLIENTPS